MVFPVFQDKDTWFHVVGYLYAVVLPYYFLARTSQRLWVRIATPEGVPPDIIKKGHRNDLPALLGFLERTMYVAAWNVGHPEFIGIWMGLKVAGGWNAWTHGYEPKGAKDSNGEQVRVNGRHMFNTHLIGSALSAINSVTGALMTTWLIRGDWSRAVWVGFATFLMTYAIWLWSEKAPLEYPAAPSNQRLQRRANRGWGAGRSRVR